MGTLSTLRAWLLLRAVKGLSDSAFCRLIQTFGSPEAVLTASIHDLQARGQLRKHVAYAIHQPLNPEAMAAVDQDLEHIEAGTFLIVTLLDKGYPHRLKMIDGAPPFLYVTGSLEETAETAIAIVGARRASAGGVAFTEQLSFNLASLGLTIVSGLARGIDAAAHRGALKAGGRTIAVLGCGIDKTYPPEHARLRKEIEANGAVISEFPTGTPPKSFHFPRRNRLISGLALGVVVTEAALQSGSLITARFALEQNREVFAVPGSVHSDRHRGPHALIRQGAKLVETAEDVVEELLPQLDHAVQARLRERQPAAPPPVPKLTTEERILFDLFSDDPLSVDELTAQAQFLPAEVMSIALSLELKGLIRQLPGSQYIRAVT